MKTALVVMPFQSVASPNMGVSLLKAVLARKGIQSDVYYFNLWMAKRLGVTIYEDLGGMWLFSEWFFSRSLFPENESSAKKALEAVPSHELSEKLLEIFRRDPGLFDRISKAIAPRFLEECLREVPWQEYGLVGFSSSFNSHVASLSLAKRIKERAPGVRIAVGGSNAEGEMGWETLRGFEWVDAVVSGEGEEALCRTVKQMAEGRPPDGIPGVSYRWKGGVFINKDRPRPANLDGHPAPDHSDYFKTLDDLGLNTAIRPVIPFESSRGCWWGEHSHCTFCGLNGSTMTFRRKSPRKVIREIFRSAKNYRVTHFRAADNILDMAYLKTFVPLLARLLEKHRLDIHIFYEVKANMKKEQIERLCKAGVRMVQPGIESLDSNVLRLVRKGITPIRNIQFLKFCLEFGVKTVWNHLYGVPGEKKESYDGMARWIPRLSHLPPPDSLSRVRIDRFSPYYTDSAGPGYQDVRPEPLYRVIYPEKQVRLEKIAYFFTGKFKGDNRDPEDSFKRLRAGIEHWRRFHEESFLVHRFIFDCLMVYDYRPSPGGRLVFRIHRYDGALARSVYEFCDSVQSFKDICEEVRRTHGRTAHEGAVRAVLSEFLSAGLMFQEGAEYLSLSVPLSSRSESLKERIRLLESFHQQKPGGRVSKVLVNPAP